MKVIVAEALGMCFGVRDALADLKKIANPEEATIHGELVHNERVLHDLTHRGFQMIAEDKRSGMPPTQVVVITAHGISDAERRKFEESGKQLIDTTCPLVKVVHEAAQKLQQDGYHVLVIGRAMHVEVRGIVGDLHDFHIIETVNDVVAYDHARLGVICQSTTPEHFADEILALIREKNPGKEIVFRNTICKPTRERQEAMDKLIEQVDALVVVGGKNSNNTRELAESARRRGKPAVHIQSAADLDHQWLLGFDTIGLTAGTSTLPDTVDEVHQEILRIAERAESLADCGTRPKDGAK